MKLLALSTVILVPSILAAAVPDAAPAMLEKRANKICKVPSKNTPCYRLPGILPPSGDIVWHYFQPTDTFLVNCKVYATSVQGNTVWDWVPAWNCWISAHYTKPTDGSATCETGVPVC